ncbi:SCAN domain-containing protein 3 [Caerostris darwini]|uniref:SCAN domain-containing protein 3 n=1 Tax=Caerostris darwini TaxID=1538125 RepID=A0AAV4MAW6_9ARAC|nr:SCAN domain-containing protein 3 [Caerostris darwini]
MINETAGRVLSKMSLSINTNSYRMQHMAEEHMGQLTEQVKEMEFVLQLDKADNNKDVLLICYVRFIDDYNIVEDLFCKNGTTEAKAQDLFQIIDTFISENSIYRRIIDTYLKRNPNALWIHRIIHRVVCVCIKSCKSRTESGVRM